MLKRERQVLMTYVTWRWFWLIGVCVLFFALIGGLTLSNAQADFNPYNLVFPLAMPIMMGLGILVAAAKWQFANPRARLTPDFGGPHLRVLGAILLFVLVANPLANSYFADIPPSGPLSYCLVLAGTFLWAVQVNRGWAVLPTMVVFFSSLAPAGTEFWFSNQAEYQAAHTLLVLVGVGLVGSWLWRLAHLDEEMGDYAVGSMGGWSRLSRLESAEQRKLEGRMAGRTGPAAMLADSWHDQLPQPASGREGRMKLLRYGFSKAPAPAQAAMVGLSLVVYCLLLYRVMDLFRGDDSLERFPWFPTCMAVAIPMATAMIHLSRRRGRMAQELLRGMTRQNYVDGMLQALAKQSLLFWVALHIALAITLLLIDIPAQKISPRAIGTFFFLSFCLQLPAFGAALQIARWNSMVVQMIGLYAVGGAQLALLGLWWDNPEFWGAWPVLAVDCIVLAILGVATIISSRRVWLRAELG